MVDKITIFTGSGISEESGIETFRNSINSTWENYSVDDIATLKGWKKDPRFLTDFYNKRRIRLKDVKPNLAHKSLVKLEDFYDVTIITQNVDDLHERAGSTKIYKLHGDLKKVRSVVNPKEIYDWGYNPVDYDKDRGKNNARLRPHVVWFGEYPDKDSFKKGYESIMNCDILIIIGTSFEISYTIDMIYSVDSSKTKIYYIDPSPSKYLDDLNLPINYIKEKAVKGVTTLVNNLIKNKKNGINKI